MEPKEQYKEAFKILKEEADINSVFSEFNRQMVLAISSGDAHPRDGGTLGEVLKDIHENRTKVVGDEFLQKNNKSDDFVKADITDKTAFRYYTIEIPQYRTYVDYFVNLGEVDSDEVPAAETYIEYYRDSDSVCATIMIRQKHECVSDETIGKILKHELTHVVLFSIQYLSSISIDYSSSIADENDRKTFDEFLCDYIQCEYITGPNDSPVAVFDDVCENYLTWVANDAYVPYKEAVVEYYKELEESIEGKGQEC